MAANEGTYSIELGGKHGDIVLRDSGGKYKLKAGLAKAREGSYGSFGIAVMPEGTASNTSGGSVGGMAELVAWLDEKPFLSVELAAKFASFFAIEFPYRPETLRLSFSTAGSIVDFRARISPHAVIPHDVDWRKNAADLDAVFAQGDSLPLIRLKAGQAKLIIKDPSTHTQQIRMICTASKNDGPIKLLKLALVKDNDRVLNEPIVLSRMEFVQPVFRVYAYGDLDRQGEAKKRRYDIRLQCETTSGQILATDGFANSAVMAEDLF